MTDLNDTRGTGTRTDHATTAAAHAALEAVGRISEAMRQHSGGAIVTGIARMSDIGVMDTHLYHVINAYINGRMPFYTNRDAAPDYGLRGEACPLQHALDELQRRTR